MKKHVKAGILSTVFMGLGQGLINKEYIKAIIFAIYEIFILLNINYFYRSIRGLITLGEVTGYTGTESRLNDHSIFLMIDGWIAILLLVLVLLVYYFNIKDAVSRGKALEESGKPQTFKEYWNDLITRSFPYLMSIPAIFGILFFILMPILFTIAIAFTNYSSPDYIPPANLVSWVGLENIKTLIRLPMWNTTFLGVFSWTVIWALSVTFLNYTIGLLIAILVKSKDIKFKKVWRTIYFLPYAVPALISLLIFRNLLNGQFGPINLTLKELGIIDEYFGLFGNNIGWLSDPLIARFSVIGVTIWLGFPYFMALLTGIMTSIDNSLYEASTIDGATKIQQFLYITLPMVLQATVPLIIMNFSYNFNNFGGVFFLTEGGPFGVYDSGSFAGATDILITWIYKLIFNYQQYNVASMMSLLIFLIVGSFSLWNFSRTKQFKDL